VRRPRRTRGGFLLQESPLLRSPSGDSAERTALNTVSAWLANLVFLIVGFFLTRFLLDQLGERLYGVYSLGASVAAWSAFAGIPIGTYAYRYGIEHLEKGEQHALDRMLATSLGLSLLAAAFLTVPVIAWAGGARRLLRVPDDLVGPARAAILIIGLGAVLTVVVRVWEATVFMSRRIYLKNFADMASRIAGAVVLVAWFVWLGPSVTVWLLVTVGLPLLLSLCYVIPAAARGLPVRLLSVSLDRAELRRALPFIALLAANSIGGMLFDNTSAFVISVVPELGVEQIAAFDVGARWQSLVRPFVEAFITALAPGLVALAARRESSGLHKSVTTHTRQLLILGMIPTVSLACVARPLVSHWVGEQFVARSVPVMWATLASALFWGPGPYAARLLVALSRMRFATFGGIVAGLANLALSVFFVRVLGLGLFGVAAGTLITVVVWCDIVMTFEVCRAIGLRPLVYLREVWLRPAACLPLMLLVGAGLAHWWHPRSLGETLVQLLVSGMALTVVAFRIGLTREESAGISAWTARRLDRIRK
jgi:O-antigen/teichoic acid export membrane protein